MNGENPMRRILAILMAVLTGLACAEPAKIDGFEIDKILPVGNSTADLHYHLYVPASYDGKEPYALYISLPGYGGYYFQGIGVNLLNERFAVEAKKYNPRMIIAAPQPEDWGPNSKRQVIALTEYLLGRYSIDRNKVYISGFSGGGETLSLAVAERPDLYAAALHNSSRWDGGFDKIVAARTPVCFVIGESDEYYSSRPARDAYATLAGLYRTAGLAEEQIAELAVLDIKKAAYFTERNMKNQHGGGTLFAHDAAVMGWLFGNH